MLASTIQFSKYGQEHQPYITTTLEQGPSGTKHPRNLITRSLVRAGPNHTPHRSLDVEAA
jgi:hypothetical protein